MDRPEGSLPPSEHREVSLAEWEERKRFVGFTEEDAKLLPELRLMAVTYGDAIVEELYRRFFLYEELRAFFPDEATIGYVKGAQKKYFVELTNGEYGEKYLAQRLDIGRTHKRVGLSPRWYIGAYSIYAQLAFPHVVAVFRPDFDKARRVFSALLKLIMLDVEVAITAYIATEGQRGQEPVKENVAQAER